MCLSFIFFLLLHFILTFLRYGLVTFSIVVGCCCGEQFVVCNRIVYIIVNYECFGYWCCVEKQRLVWDGVMCNCVFVELMCYGVLEEANGVKCR